MEVSAWQTKFSSFKERHLYAYNHSLFCDVELSVKDANGDKVTIPAHKYVLAISSPVFEAMFYGESAETGRTIDLPDCTKEGLQELLRFVYSDEVNLSGNNVLEVPYLAEKYRLPFLKQKCEEYLEKELKPEDVFRVLPQPRSQTVKWRCWDMVDEHTKRAVSSEAFLNISKVKLLCEVLARDTLCIDEVDLFDAVEKWALKKLKEEGLEESMENKRAVLGEEVIKLIRFPLMSEKQFVEKVRPSEILKMDEVTELIQFLRCNELSPSKCSFSNTKRGKCKIIVPNTRFDLTKQEKQHSLSDNLGLQHAIDFKVNTLLSLAGVRLFGSEGSSQYEVTLTLFKSGQQITQISSTFQTEDKKTDGYHGFTVHLDETVPLDPHVVYTVIATISGPPSYVGLRGKTTIAFEDIVITYLNSEKSKNETTTEKGQFPTLVLKRH